jgi:CspA family cold shock protein
VPRALKPKTLTRITPAREGSTYQLEVEDEAGKRVLFALTSDQALLLAEQLDGLLADEEEELHPRPAVALQPVSAAPREQGSLGTVKWYNEVKGFGFVVPDGGGEEVFLHRSALEQVGLNSLVEGTRVRFQVGQGQKGLQVNGLTLV